MKKVLCGFIVVFVLLITVSCRGPKTPGEAAKYYTEKLYNGEVEEVLDAYVTPPKGEKRRQYIALVQGKLPQTVKEKKGLSKVEIVEEKVAEDGKKAKVDLKIIFGDESTDTDTMRMKLIDGAWKIDEKI